MSMTVEDSQWIQKSIRQLPSHLSSLDISHNTNTRIQERTFALTPLTHVSSILHTRTLSSTAGASSQYDKMHYTKAIATFLLTAATLSSGQPGGIGTTFFSCPAGTTGGCCLSYTSGGTGVNCKFPYLLVSFLGLIRIYPQMSLPSHNRFV